MNNIKPPLEAALCSTKFRNIIIFSKRIQLCDYVSYSVSFAAKQKRKNKIDMVVVIQRLPMNELSTCVLQRLRHRHDAGPL